MHTVYIQYKKDVQIVARWKRKSRTPLIFLNFFPAAGNSPVLDHGIME
jgi:hypothetical protein